MVDNEKTKSAVFRKIDFVDQQQLSRVSDKNQVTSIICRICDVLISRLDISQHAREHELLPQFLPIKEAQEFFEILQVSTKMADDDKNETKENNSSIINAGDEGAWSCSGPEKEVSNTNKKFFSVNSPKNTMENSKINFFDHQAYNEFIMSNYALCQDKNCETCLKQKVHNDNFQKPPIKKSNFDKQKVEKVLKEKKLNPRCESSSPDKQKTLQKILKEKPKFPPAHSTKKIPTNPKTIAFPKPPEKIKYVCSTCDIKVYQKSHVIIHLNSQQHKSKVRDLKFELEFQLHEEFEDIDLPIGVEMINDKFNCKFCKLVVDKIEDLLMHLEDLDHLEKLGSMYIDSDALEIVYGFPRGIKATKLSEVFYCAICCCTIKNYENINTHVSFRSHEASLNVFLGKISLREKKKPYLIKRVIENVENTKDFPEEIKKITNGSGYYCEACNVKITKPFPDERMDIAMKVWQHINGKTHFYYVSCLKRTTTIGKRDCSNDENNQLDFTGYVSTLSLEELYDIKVEDCKIVSATCKACQLTFYGRTEDIVEDWNEHLMTRRHLEREKKFSENFP